MIPAPRTPPRKPKTVSVPDAPSKPAKPVVVVEWGNTRRKLW